MAPFVRYWLEHGGRRVELRGQSLVIGRGEGCELVLDDALVSRRHARISIHGDPPQIEDLGSSNGLAVNGDKVEQSPLQDGDRIQIGKQEIVFRRIEVPQGARAMAETLHGDATLGPISTSSPAGSEPILVPGEKKLEVLGPVADKVLALHRGEEAERLLTPVLQRELEAARKLGSAPPLASMAAKYAVRLAQETGNGAWVNYAFELYTVAKEPLPADVVELLYEVVRKVKDFDREIYDEYVRILDGESARFGPRERFLVKRIAGLEQLFG